MNVFDSFPSKYLRAADIDHEITVVIDRVELAELGRSKDRRPMPIVFFVGKKKGLVLNKVNATSIAAVCGPETDAWPGARLTLYPTQATFAGQPVPALRVKAVDAGARVTTGPLGVVAGHRR